VSVASGMFGRDEKKYIQGLLGKPAQRRALGQPFHRCEGNRVDHKQDLINLLKPTGNFT
jgi:hypothetical protein